MQINRKTKITLTSRIMILLAKFGLPDASKILLSKGQYVTNDEMYSLQQDRIDANPKFSTPTM